MKIFLTTKYKICQQNTQILFLSFTFSLRDVEPPTHHVTFSISVPDKAQVKILMDHDIEEILLPGPEKLWKLHFNLQLSTALPTNSRTFRVYACGEMYEYCMKALSHALERRNVLNCIEHVPGVGGANGVYIFIVAKSEEDAVTIPSKVKEASSLIRLKVRLVRDDDIDLHILNGSHSLRLLIREKILQQLHLAGIVQLGEHFVDTATLNKLKGEADCCSISISVYASESLWSVEMILFPQG
jgi:hypothetical protein